VISSYLSRSSFCQSSRVDLPQREPGESLKAYSKRIRQVTKSILADEVKKQSSTKLKRKEKLKAFKEKKKMIKKMKQLPTEERIHKDVDWIEEERELKLLRRVKEQSRMNKDNKSERNEEEQEKQEDNDFLEVKINKSINIYQLYYLFFLI
jgi:hypothetical protein